MMQIAFRKQCRFSKQIIFLWKVHDTIYTSEGTCSQTSNPVPGTMEQNDETSMELV